MQRVFILVAALMFSTQACAQVVANGPDPIYLAVAESPCTGGGVGGATHCINPDRGIPLNYYATSTSVLAGQQQLQTQVDSLGGTVAGNQNQLQNLTGTVAANQSQLAAQIASLTATVNSNQQLSASQIASLTSALNSSVAQLNSKIDSSFAAIAALQTQFVAMNTLVAASTSARLSGISSEVARALEIGTIAAAMRDAIPNAGDRFAIRVNMAASDGYAAGAFGISMNLTDSVRLSANYGRGATQNVVSGGMNVSFR